MNVLHIDKVLIVLQHGERHSTVLSVVHSISPCRSVGQYSFGLVQIVVIRKLENELLIKYYYCWVCYFVAKAQRFGQCFVPLTVGKLSVVRAGDNPKKAAHFSDQLMIEKLKLYIGYDRVDVREMLLPDNLPLLPYSMETRR